MTTCATAPGTPQTVTAMRAIGSEVVANITRKQSPTAAYEAVRMTRVWYRETSVLLTADPQRQPAPRPAMR